jgi:hypothetical protein
MSVLRSFENKIAGLVEGAFSRAFRSEVRPVEIARKLQREMEEHKTVSVSRTYVPNEYAVYLSQEDRRRMGDVEEELRHELAGYLLEHARREKLALLTRPQVTFCTDERLSLGEFGIQARLVRPSDQDAGAAREPAPERSSAPVDQGDYGRTMVYTSAERLRGPLTDPMHPHRGTALVVVEGRRMPVKPEGAVLGRSRDCDVVVDDPNVSRRHAELRPSGGSWVICDLGSTNGVKVNGKRIEGSQPLKAGDRVELGTAPLSFELE